MNNKEEKRMATGKQNKNDFAVSGSSKRAKPEQESSLKLTDTEVMKELKEIKEMLSIITKKVTDLTEEVSNINKKMDVLELKSNNLEERMLTVEEEICYSQADRKKIEILIKDLEDFSNRERRSNIRLIGLPEGAELGNPVTFIEKLLPKLLPLQTKFPIEIERAHRVPLKRAVNQQGPRPFIFKLLRHQQAIEILQLAKKNKGLKYQDAFIHLVPDFAKNTAVKRKKLLDLRPKLRELGAKFGLVYPATMKVTIGNKTLSFSDPEKLEKFIQNQEVPMSS